MSGQKSVIKAANRYDVKLADLLKQIKNEAAVWLLIHASNEASQIIVWSLDIDVVILCVHFCRQFAAELWFQTDVGKYYDSYA